MTKSPWWKRWQDWPNWLLIPLLALACFPAVGVPVLALVGIVWLTRQGLGGWLGLGGIAVFGIACYVAGVRAERRRAEDEQILLANQRSDERLRQALIHPPKSN